MKKLAAAAALALMAVPTTAAAQDTTIIKQFTLVELQRALDLIGATYEDAGDDRSINITFASNLVANGAVMACDDIPSETNCLGTSILATFDPPSANASPEEIMAAVNAYNYSVNFGRAYVDPDGVISLRAYIIADGGITRENYRMQVLLWTIGLEDFADILYGPPTGTTPAPKPRR